ncbi:uncharacterized protein LOC141536651 isoform X2 [Cotesia typhae]|uniref:uncharacterized protein LOC141536651 isoform X2 n=1 Tax=Cotesia typhae TaxID=2053667 RepID=UPI003D692939
MKMDQQEAVEVDKENDSSAINISEINEPLIHSKPAEAILSTSGNSVENDGYQNNEIKTNDQVRKVIKNSTLGEKFKKQLKLLDEGSSDGNLDVDGTESSKVSKNDAEPFRTSSNLKRSLIGKGKSSKKSKKRKVSDDNNKSEMNQAVVTPATVTSNANHHISTTESEAQLTLIPSSPLDKNNSQVKTDRSTSKTGKKSRKTKEKELNYDAILKILNKISDDVDWLKKHHTGLESFIIENLTANLENWNQVKHVQQAPSNNPNLTIEDINRPPAVGYVRIDTNMIHLGQNVWLPKQSYDDAVYNAATNSMFVKNIAMAVFGSQYLKEHSVKGKGCNKTKSKPRPAIDPTKALAIRDIFEYYLKTNKQLIGSNLLSERDTYEDHIRAKISDLLRPPKTSKPKVPKVPPKPKESSSSSYENSVGSDDEKNTEEETQKEDAAEESSVE